MEEAPLRELTFFLSSTAAAWPLSREARCYLGKYETHALKDALGRACGAAPHSALIAP
jgi:hypothetical protein